MRAFSDGSKKPLIAAATHGLAWNLGMAVLLLEVVTRLMRWRDLRFTSPASA